MKRILQITFITLAIRILYYTLSVFLSASEGKTEPINFKSFKNIFYQNDSYWYEKISKEGYPKISNPVAIGFSYKETYVQSSWAFFPFYPWLNNVLMRITGWTFTSSAFFISFVFSIFAFTGFYQFCKVYTGNDKKAFFYTILLIVLPFDYYFFVFYTEALFFTFLIYSFLAIYYRREWVLPFLLVPLTLLRPNGLILTLPLFVYYLETNEILVCYKLQLSKVKVLKTTLTVLLFSTALIAFLMYGMYQRKMTGNFFAFSQAQRGWYREFMFPILAFFRRGDFATQFNSFYTIAVIIFAAFTCKKLPLSLNLLLWMSLIFPMCSGSMTSMQRFITVIFPLTMLLGDRLYHRKYSNTILMTLLVLQLFIFSFWLKGIPFSF